MKKYIQVPRGYLSQSQVALWQRNPTQYKAIYFDDRSELRPSNIAMDYGKLFAEAMEHGKETGDLLSDAAMLLIPKYDIRDQEFRVDLKVGKEWVSVLAKPDLMDSETKNFIEVKTGKVPWTQAKVQKHLQLLWYATAIYLAHGVIPKVKLVWVETFSMVSGTDDSGLVEERVVTPTGRVEEFEVVYTLRDILNTMSLIGTVAKEIEVAWAAHEVDPRIATF